MRVFLLYTTTVLIWGTTWIAIKLQLGVVALEVSIFYRFAFAVVILFFVQLLFKKLEPIGRKDHLFCLLQGIFLFCLNFYALYSATQYITSGLVSILFSLSTIFNVFNNWLWYKIMPSAKTVIGSIIGITGITILFWPQLAKSNFNPEQVLGVALASLGTYFFSTGNLISVRHKKRNLPLLTTNSWGMLYGAGLMLIIILIRDIPFNFDRSPTYIGSLLFLVIPGTLIVFLTYLTLINDIGVDKAAYATVLFPIIALTFSTFLEGYQWNVLNVLGVAIALLGNIIVFSKARLPSVSSMKE